VAADRIVIGVLIAARLRTLMYGRARSASPRQVLQIHRAVPIVVAAGILSYESAHSRPSAAAGLGDKGVRTSLRGQLVVLVRRDHFRAYFTVTPHADSAAARGRG